jgi:antitoxin MazE
MQQIHVTKWGSSLGFRIPKGVAESMDIQAGDALEITPAEDGLLIKKAASPRKRYVLADILDSFDPAASSEGEADFGQLRGEEIW